MKYLPDFIQVPGVLYKDREIKSLDRDIYGIIYWCAKLYLKKCTMSNRAIAELLNVSAGSVANSISRLAKHNYVKVVINDKNHREELIPLITYNSTPSSTDDTPFIPELTPPSSTNEQNKRTKNKNNNPNGLLGQDQEKEEEKDRESYGNPEIACILTSFKENLGRIPADKKPNHVAQNIRQRINTFIKRNGSLYRNLRGQELSFDYVLDRSWHYFKQKDYAQDTEKLETFKLKMIVYLDLVESDLKRKEKHFETAN